MAERPLRPEQIRELVARAVDAASAAAPASPGTPASGPADPAAASSTITHLAIGADHGGYQLKERLAADLRDRGYTVHDCGTSSTDAVDYPDIAHAVAREVASGACQAGIVVDGAGIGSAIAANKVPGVRAATCWDVTSAVNSREHNHANVLSIGAGLLGENLCRQIVSTWLRTPYGPSRHARRVDKITALEQRYATRPS